MNLIPLALILLTTQTAWAQDNAQVTLVEKLKDIQKYSQDADERNSPGKIHNRGLKFKGGSLDISENGETTKLIFKSTKTEQYSVELPSKGFSRDQTLIDPENNKIISFQSGSLVILDFKNKTKTQCEMPPNSGYAQQLTQVGKDYFFHTNVQNDDAKITTTINQIVNDGDSCQIKQISKLTNSNDLSFRLFNANGNIGVIQEQSKWGPYTHTGTANLMTFDKAGKKLTEVEFRNFRPSDHAFRDYKSPSFNNAGTLILLIDKNDPEQRSNAYVIKDNSVPELIAKNAISAEWISDGIILFNKGAHSASSELYLLDANKHYKATKIEAPRGFKSNVRVENGKVTFENSTHDKVIRKYQADIESGHGIEISSHSNQLTPKVGELPDTQEIGYPSGDHQVASFLSISKSGCKESEKKPVVVYLHGGAYNSAPNSAGGQGENDYVMFTQLGWPVIEAGYYGDEYYGEEFRRGLDRWVDKDRYTRTLQDIQAAGEYAKTLPCADPRKIILLGHSHGRIVANLYATDKTYSKTSPYSGIILRNGVADDKDIAEFIGGLASELAVPGGDGNKSTIPNIELDGVTPVCHTETDIVGVDNALKLLKEMNKISEKFYGVPYKFTEETLNEIMPMRRSQNVIDKPILIVSTSDGSGDGTPGSETRGSKTLEKELKKYSSKVKAWYPNELFKGKYKENGHVLDGDIEIEFILKVKKWVESL